jgi:phospholipid/cholesterol/gamma-HCH transport system substrate-binding protein
MNSILADADAGKGGLGVMLKDPKFAKDMTDTLAQANQIVTQINQGKGTIGKLLNDDTTSTNLNNLLTESTKLVTTIRQDPKKYLTIHMKIF